MGDFLKKNGGNPGRAGHKMAIAAERKVEECRKLVADFVGAGDPRRIIFTLNCTDAINIALNGVIKENSHIITSILEHNSVLRPLEELKKKRNITVTKVKPNNDGYITTVAIEEVLQKNTSLIVITHASNVIGTIQPIEEIALLAKKHDILLLVDAAQTVGVIPINVEKLNIPLLAFPGHKGLLGPTGMGCLYVAEAVEVEPLRYGGSGMDSSLIFHPKEYPYHLEAGTPNTAGIAGLLEGIKYLKENFREIKVREKMLTERLFEGLKNIDGVTIYKYHRLKVGTVSITLKNLTTDELGALLDEEFNIAVRSGLHCAPYTHKWLGTFPDGTVRFSIGPFNTEEEIDTAIEAVKDISSGL